MLEPSPSRALLVAALIVGAALALSACGQKGDLYLPDEPVEQVSDDEDA
jgi:predicted small lipoprotein YifL